MGGTKTINQQQPKHRLRTDSGLSGGGGLNAFYWRQILALDSVVVKTQKVFCLHGGFLANAMHHHIKSDSAFVLMKRFSSK